MSVYQAQRLNTMNTELNKSTAASDAAMCWLARLNAPDLSPAEQQRFEQWLAASPVHQLAYIQAEQLWDRGIVLDRVPAPAEVSSTGRVWFKPALAAACLLVCIGIFFSSSLFRSDTGVYTEYTTDAGEILDVTLPDGSSAFLNARTSISVSFDDNFRRVKLTSGEAFFKVVRNAKRPFEVITESGRARVLGTAFSVNQDAVVTVLEGRVGIAQNNDTFKPLVILRENQQLSVSAAAAGERPQAIDASAKLAWRQQKLIYHGERLQVVIDDLQQYYGKKIIVEDLSILNNSVVIVLHLADFNTTILSLAGALKLRTVFSEVDDQVILQSGD